MLHTEVALNAFRAQTGCPSSSRSASPTAGSRWPTTGNRRRAPCAAAGTSRSDGSCWPGELGLADRHLARVTERIQNDATLLLVFGTVKETQASRALATVSGGKLDEPATAAQARDAAREQAIAILQRALAADPMLVEAKLRLAHLFTMKHDDAKAEALLKDVLWARRPRR